MRLWMIFVPMFSLWGLNGLYDVWKASPPSAQTELRRKCIGLASDAGIARGIAAEGCNCAVNKARGWADANPGAEYTIDVHRKLTIGCFNAAQAKSDNALSQPGVFSSAPHTRKPALPPGATSEDPEDLGWGSQ